MHVKRILLVCIALVMVIIVITFGIYFFLEKVTVNGAAERTGDTLRYEVRVETIGKYTLKSADVTALFLDENGNVIKSITETVKGNGSAERVVAVPVGYAKMQYRLDRYSLNNIYEVIVMCLCSVVFLSTVLYLGTTFVRKKDKDAEPFESAKD